MQWGGVLFQPWGSHRRERIWDFPENEIVRRYHSARPHFTISTLKFSRKSATMPFNSSLFYNFNKIPFNLSPFLQDQPWSSQRRERRRWEWAGCLGQRVNLKLQQQWKQQQWWKWRWYELKWKWWKADDNILTRPAFSTPIASFLLSASTIASAFLSTFD